MSFRTSVKNLYQTRRNLFWALVVVGIFVLWMASGMGASAPEKAEKTQTPPADLHAEHLTAHTSAIVAEQFTAQPYQQHLALPATSAARYRAQVAAQTGGRITSLEAENGEAVAAGRLLVTLDAAERRVSLTSAKASLAAATKLATSARTLAKDGYMSQTTLAEREAAEAEARARVESIEQDLSYTRITAPLAGVVENRRVSTGDVVAPGTALLDIVNRKDLLLTAYLPQKDRNKVQVGQTASATLITGEEVAGTVDFVATDADPQSRTYQVNIAVDGEKYPMPTGMSAEVDIPTGTTLAYTLPHHLAVLDDAGTLGVMQKIMPENGPATAHFVPVTLLYDTPDTMVVTGLPVPSVTLITRGHLTLADGTEVE